MRAVGEVWDEWRVWRRKGTEQKLGKATTSDKYDKAQLTPMFAVAARYMLLGICLCNVVTSGWSMID